MRILITGAAGFAGPHLIKELAAHGHECIATDLTIAKTMPACATCEAVDIRDANVVNALIARTRPEGCIHMAGITFVPAGTSDPDLMLSVNVRGTLNLLEAVRQHTPACRVLTISTAHVYGVATRNERLTEDAPLRPTSMYGISKAAADLTTLAFAAHHNLPAMVARPNNHTGPGQQPRFVVPAFAQQVTAIAAGHSEPRIRVGNLESVRDFMDVRDVVRAYRLLLEQGQAGQAYNIASNHAMPIGDVLKRLCRLKNVHPELVTDPNLVRPTDWSPDLDTTRITAHTGWTPTTTFEQTLTDILNTPAG